MKANTYNLVLGRLREKNESEASLDNKEDQSQVNQQQRPMSCSFCLVRHQCKVL